MSLTAGQRLGPYEIVAPLGAGGMGEVYRARDTRLGREVALKVLPGEFAADPARRQRLEREAQAISALSHPHVCALFDVGRAELPSGPVEFLVMELVEGETLAQRLERGPISASQVVSLGAQIAGGLGAAHARGIVHRDLKPGNVMLTRSGAKLLDFGLARAGDNGSLGLSPKSGLTESIPLTREGTVVGTWPYLSPEQLRGRPADARSDVFALGAVLCEMLTARRAFPGSTLAEVSAAILQERVPDPRDHVPSLPAPLVGVVRKCLEQDPAARWQSADDVGLALRLVGEASADDPGVSTSRRSSRLWPALSAVLGIATALAVASLILRRAPAPEPLRFVVRPPAGTLLPRPTMGLPLAAAPDGRRVAFVASTGGVQGLWLWSGEDGEARRLGGTEGATSPFFSPDGRELAFFAADELRRIGVTGGPATRVARTPSGHSGTWGADGTIIFSRWLGPEAGLWSVPAGGGELRRLVPAPRLAELRGFPSFLPDGRHYLFLNGAMGGRVGDRRACVASIDGGEPDCVATCDSQATYSGTGHIVCVRRGTLVAQPFDASRRRTTGEAVTIAPDVRWFGPPGTASFAVSANGRLIVHEPAPGASRLAWLDRSGREVARLGEAARYGQLELTRDGRRVALEMWSQETGSRDLWSLDTASGVATRLTLDQVEANSPVWSPDGGRMAFGSTLGGPPDVAVRTLDGGRVETILEAPGVQLPQHWSPDGRLIAYQDFLTSRRDQQQVWLLTLDGQRRRFHETPANVYSPRFSPDSRTLAFVSEESGRPEVYVAPVDGSGMARRLSRTGGLLPRWRADGREMFFFQPDGMMVSVDPGASDAPHLLFHVDGVVSFDFNYDVSADGQRFLVRLSPQPEGSAGLRLALDWSRDPVAARAGGRPD